MVRHDVHQWRRKCVLEVWTEACQSSGVLVAHFNISQGINLGKPKGLKKWSVDTNRKIQSLICCTCMFRIALLTTSSSSVTYFLRETQMTLQNYGITFSLGVKRSFLFWRANIYYIHIRSIIAIPDTLILHLDCSLLSRKTQYSQDCNSCFYMCFL